MQHAINLVAFGDSYITEPLELERGDYIITDFLITDASSVVQYATPHAGSPLAAIVKHPLTTSFKVTNGKVNTVEMQVVAVDDHTPEDFGYVSFGVHAVRPLSLAVFTFDNNVAKLTNGIAYLLHENDTLKTYKVGSKINLLPFTEDPQATYTLVIIKEGYAKYVQEFVFDELTAQLNHQPLKIYLTPALTLSVNYKFFDLNDPTISFGLEVKNSGYVSVDWGDGKAHESFYLDNADYETVLVHDYENKSREYFISITGALAEIIGFTGDYTGLEIQKLSLKHLAELRSVNFFISGPYVSDLRFNNKLEFAILRGNQVFLPEENNIKDLYMDGQEGLIPYIDYIINNVHKNALRNETMGGKFSFSESVYGDLDVMLVAPSAASLLKLQELKNSLGWTIFPSIEVKECLRRVLL